MPIEWWVEFAPSMIGRCDHVMTTCRMLCCSQIVHASFDAMRYDLEPLEPIWSQMAECDHRVLQGVAQKGVQFHFIFAVLQTLFSCSKISLFSLKLAPP